MKNHRLCAAGFVWSFMAITNHNPPEPTTTSTANAATDTPLPYATCSTASSANSTTAWSPVSTTDPAKAFGAPEAAAA